MPKNVEIFIRIAAVFVAFTFAISVYQDGDTFYDKVLHVLPFTAPIALVVVICTVLFLRSRSAKASTQDAEADFGEHPPLT
ncbi:hypothetical protein [Rhodococcus sp. NPDC058521]|uniref:hypothetical protein n=1 Tax=Rhodococcus sp. NPDC058521 TaxID=3346536 RepID=UPI0036496802